MSEENWTLLFRGMPVMRRGILFSCLPKMKVQIFTGY
jgi:hypothetical protein